MFDILDELSSQRAQSGAERPNHRAELDNILKSPERPDTPPPSDQSDRGTAHRRRPASPDGTHTPPKEANGGEHPDRQQITDTNEPGHTQTMPRKQGTETIQGKAKQNRIFSTTSRHAQH
jgi:hypothetical protein